MKRIRHLVVEHRHHILASFILAGAIFAALMLVNHLEIGGIEQHAGLLFLGFIMSECGRSLTCFGVKLKRKRLEHAGVFVQGLAWWAWSINLPFLSRHSGWPLAGHLLLPALLIGFFPVIVHHGAKHLCALFSIDEESEES